MPSRPSPSSAVQAARQALADRLKDIRLAAGFSTGRAFSHAAGWSVAKTSRIENAVQTVDEDDITTWCRVCEVPELADGLIARLRLAEGAYVEWQRLQRGGYRRLQQSYVPLFERTGLFRVYAPQVVPGLVQTAAYAATILERFAVRQGVVVDEGAVAARLERQAFLHSNRRFVILLEHHTLIAGLGGPAVMGEQRGRLLDVATLPNVRLGVIPPYEDRMMWTMEPVSIYDAAQVNIELLTARVTVTAGEEVRRYIAAFEDLATMAVYGDEAATLIAESGEWGAEA